MSENRIGSIIVVNGDARPLGIFTLRDLLVRVTLAGQSLDAPIAEVMSRALVTLPQTATAYEAVSTVMTRQVHHIIVLDGDRLKGVVSEKDLFGLQRSSMHELSRAIGAAGDMAALAGLAADIRSLARNLLLQGTAAEQLTLMIASLNDLLTRRIIELTMPPDLPAWCWIALGSEGRHEQTLATDQDNGLIFHTEEDAEEARRVLLPLAQRINKALHYCGFPLCKGNIMAGNSLWCLSVAEWQARFRGWMGSGDPEALLGAAVFFDFRGVAGEENLANALRSWLLAEIAPNPRFLHQMAGNALRNQPPLGLLHDFSTTRDADGRQILDLKVNGATLFTDAARIYGLAAGSAQTNTAARLLAWGEAQHVPGNEIQAWIDAFQFIQLLRLRHQQDQITAGRPADNRIDPDDLNVLERRILKESLRQARLLQQRLAMDYRH